MRTKYITPATESLVLFENSYDIMLSASDGGDNVSTTEDPGFPF